MKRKKQRLKYQRQLKASVEALWNQSDVDAHRAQKTSLAARAKQRALQSFERLPEARSQLGTKERSHIPKEVTGNTEQLLEDVKKWPHEPVCWSSKAKEYNIRGNTNETTPPNGGQILKEFLKSEGVDKAPFEKSSEGENRLKIDLLRSSYPY